MFNCMQFHLKALQVISTPILRFHFLHSNQKLNLLAHVKNSTKLIILMLRIHYFFPNSWVYYTLKKGKIIYVGYLVSSMNEPLSLQ